MFRAAQACVVPEEEVERRIKDAKKVEYDRAYQAGKEMRDQHAANVRDELTKLRKEVSEFEEASGVKLAHWHYADGRNAKIGAAVKLLVGDGRWGSLKDDFERMAEHYRKLADGADAAARELGGVCPIRANEDAA